MKIKHKLVIQDFFIILSILFCLTSCGMRAEQKSLTNQFNVVDALILQNQFKEAKKELKNIQKKFHDSWTCLGIYRRYEKMGDSEASEKLLKKALKKNPENQELLAVYSKYLINNQKIDEAVVSARKLKGGKYGSIYSEAILKQAASKVPTEKEEIYKYYNEQQFYEIYFDAYQGTRNPVWLRNCAVYDMCSGLFGAAARLLPDSFADADDAYFWALVLYDSGHFYDSIEVMQKSKKFLQDFENKNLFKTSLIKQIALESDAYMVVSQMEKAEAARKELITNLQNVKIRNSEEELIPIIYTNSAIWAKDQGLNDDCVDLLFFVVSNYKDYVPALIQYADFAYYSNLEREEDAELKALRKAGISTIEMEKYDNRRKIPLSDAMYRLEDSLKRNKNPYLEIKKMDLTYKTQKDLTEKEKNRDLWKMIEDNYDDNPEFKSLLVQYSVNYLISTKQIDDAFFMYKKYLQEKITFDESKTFWETLIENMKTLELPIVEIGAWFAANNKLLDESIRLYEYCVYESSGILEDDIIAPYVSTGACMNLADIYYSNGKKDKAIALYGKAVGRESKLYTRSEIYYRIACIYYGIGDYKSALRSAEYAKNLYPENAKAGLLKDKILVISK